MEDTMLIKSTYNYNNLTPKPMQIDYDDFNNNIHNLINDFILTRDIKEKTIKNYLDSVLALAEWLKDNKDNEICHPLTPKTMKVYKEYLKLNFKPRAVNLYLSGLRQFFKCLEEVGLPNIMVNIKNVKIGQDFSKNPLTTEQFITIDEAMLEDLNRTEEKYLKGKIKKEKYLMLCRDYAILNIAVRNMLREIEMHRADKTDMQIRQNRMILKIQGKGSDDKSDFVVITEDTYKILEKYLKVRGKDNHEALFISVSSNCYGVRLSTRSFSKILKNIFKKYGNIDSPLITGHSTRHTGATMLHEAEVDLLDIKEVARHKNINTTTIYARVNNRLKNPVECKLEEHIRKERLKRV